MRRAGIERAKVLVAVLPSDADNLYVTLSARVMNPNLFIVARAEQEAAEAKLRRVGANQVVSPYVIGGHRVAQAVLRPTVGHFLEQATRPQCGRLPDRGGGHPEGEPAVRQDPSRGQPAGRDGRGGDRPALDGEIVFNPKGDSVLEPGSVVVVVGRREQLDELERLAAGTGRRPAGMISRPRPARAGSPG